MAERLLLLMGGGIGSGKSLVGRLLAERGATVIDADIVGHRVLEPGAESFKAVAERWPAVVRDGRIDRAALGEIVFSDPEQLAELESLTHPAIAALLRALVARATGPIIAVEVPVTKRLMTGPWLRVFVDAPEHLRRRRLRRRGMSPDAIDRRMAAQASRDEWLVWADRVIANDTDRGHLAGQVDQLLAELTASSARRSSQRTGKPTAARK